MQRCDRCHVRQAPRGHVVCRVCTGALRARVAPRLLAELGSYWERRLLEGNGRDWT